jgi:hypothetical protein
MTRSVRIQRGRRLVILAALALALLILSWPRVRLFFQIDSCLDSGGAWNYEQSQCER